MTLPLDSQAVLDSLGHGVLIFSTDGKLVQHNRTAGTILGTDLKVLKDEGWKGATALFDIDLDMEDRLDEVRKKAMVSERPIRFHIFRAGEYIPCWASALTASSGDLYLVLTLDVPDWAVVGNVVERFRREMREAVDTTRGHIQLIQRTLKTHKDPAAVQVAKSVSGFTRLVDIHMSRAARFMTQLERLEDVRTGALREQIQRDRKKINLEDFLEDFLESLDEVELLDPETEVADFRSRIQYHAPSAVFVNGARRYVTLTLQELIRNAMMYSLRGTPVEIRVKTTPAWAQIDVIDAGYGVRASEQEKVFKPFTRARQPQIISEFGYGLSLYLCKSEIETMGGKLWFTSDDGAGTTFSLSLPLWRDETPAPAASSSPST